MQKFMQEHKDELPALIQERDLNFAAMQTDPARLYEDLGRRERFLSVPTPAPT